MRLDRTGLEYLASTPVTDDERERETNARTLIHVALSSAVMFTVGTALAAAVVWLDLVHWVALPMFAVTLGGLGILASVIGSVLYVTRRGRL